MTSDSDLWPDAVLRYGDFPDAVIDLHVPTHPNRTLVVLIHGGFWKQEWDRTHTRHQARALARAGFLVATPEYRRVGPDYPGGGWPATAYDVRDAFVHLPTGLAGLGITVDRVVTVGHSAGGHLALWLAAQDLPIPPALTVALAPVCDLALARDLDLGDGAVAAFLNGGELDQTDPIRLLSEPPSGPVVLIHGEADSIVPIGLSRGFVAEHPWAELIALPGVDHFEFLDPRESAWQVLTDALDSGQTAP